MTIVDGSIFWNIYKAIREKHIFPKIYFPRYCNDEIIIDSKKHFYTDEKLFELFCIIENDFAKYFAKCCNLFI